MPIQKLVLIVWHNNQRFLDEKTTACRSKISTNHITILSKWLKSVGHKNSGIAGPMNHFLHWTDLAMISLELLQSLFWDTETLSLLLVGH